MGSNCYRSRRFGTAAEPLGQNHHKGACPHCGGLGLPGAGGFDADVLAGYGMRKGHAVGVEHQSTGARRAVQVVANQGVMLAGQMHANLMLAAGEQLDIDIRTRGQASAALKALEHLDARLRRLAAGTNAHLAAIVYAF